MRPDDRHRARFARLLRLYPQAYRDRFSAAMEQTFADQYTDRRASGRSIAPLVLGAYLDTTAGIAKERIVDAANRLAARPWLAALIGASAMLPLVALNTVVVYRLDPWFSIIRPGVHTGPFEFPILIAAILLLPLGAVVSLSPLWGIAAGRRRFPVVNIVVALALVAAFVALAIGFGSDIVRCDVLQIRNCD